ncbi:hypothetical protein GCM10011391_28860 [Pullulanibacillus camelliae]|uniref:Membrane protein YkvI n=1 Tax=Pullulanibacillus camelliae TaxID=1707096 RepID=A0A8J2YKL2_9BACL|nr:hypothetical protein [Pullulanibacillus camelliae]GGE48292.1 hypothetical protein GCM10011391_28860 [Pullulanibacillus camelliae]
MIKAGLKWMFLILGTMIGAGYASGRELWQFFGQESAVAIGLFTLLFIISTYVMMMLSYKGQTIHYKPVLEKLLGGKMTILYDGMIFIYLFTTTVVMLAGGGAALIAVGIPYWVGILLISGCLVLLFIRGNKGVISINIIIIPLLILLLVGVLLKFGQTTKGLWIIDFTHQSNWTSAFTFTALNVLPLAAILGAIGREIKSKGEIWIAALGSGLLLGIISFLYNESLVHVGNDVMIYEMPLFALLKNYPYAMTFVMTVLLWCAIYTTAASGILGLVTRIKKVFHRPLWEIALGLVLIMIPFTTVGFAKLITILYPIYGILNLYS